MVISLERCYIIGQMKFRNLIHKLRISQKTVYFKDFIYAILSAFSYRKKTLVPRDAPSVYRLRFVLWKKSYWQAYSAQSKDGKPQKTQSSIIPRLLTTLVGQRAGCMRKVACAGCRRFEFYQNFFFGNNQFLFLIFKIFLWFLVSSSNKNVQVLPIFGVRYHQQSVSFSFFLTASRKFFDSDFQI